MRRKGVVPLLSFALNASPVIDRRFRIATIKTTGVAGTL